MARVDHRCVTGWPPADRRRGGRRAGTPRATDRGALGFHDGGAAPPSVMAARARPAGRAATCPRCGAAWRRSQVLPPRQASLSQAPPPVTMAARRSIRRRMSPTSSGRCRARATPCTARDRPASSSGSEGGGGGGGGERAGEGSGVGGRRFPILPLEQADDDEFGSRQCAFDVDHRLVGGPAGPRPADRLRQASLAAPEA